MGALCFRQWSNKAYAAMRTVGRIVHIGTLSVAYLMICAKPMSAQSDTLSPAMHFELEEVESIAEDAAELTAAELRSVIVLSQQDLLSSPSPSLEQLLDKYPLVDIRTRGFHGIQSDLNIQGGSFDQSVVLLNGLNISDPQTGHFSLDLPLPYEHLHGVELMSGPATRNYGLNAYSGALNLLTHPMDSTTIEAEISLGQHEHYSASAALHLPAGPSRNMIAISSAQSAGYRHNTDYDKRSAFLHSQWEGEHYTADFTAAYLEKNFGANAFYSERFPDQYEETSMHFSGLSVRSRDLRPRIEGSIYWRRHRDHFVLFRDNPSVYENHHRNDVHGGELSLQLASMAGVSTAGVSLRRESILSSALGFELSEMIMDPFNDSASYRLGHSRVLPGLRLNHLLHFNRMKVSAGILLQSYQETGFYPGIDMSFELTRFLEARAGVNRSMRLPTFTDLFYQGPQNVGNPDLEAEKAISFESGLNYSRDWISWNASFFYRIGKNTIDWVWLRDEKWHTQNITELNTLGGEVSLSLDPGELTGSPRFLGQIRSAYAYMQISKAADAYISNYALDKLKHKWVLEAQFNLPFGIQMNYSLGYFSRNGTYSEYDPTIALSTELPYEAYFLHDLSFRYNIQHVTFFAEASNLLDREYRDLGAVIQPGRWIRGGFSLSVPYNLQH